MHLHNPHHRRQALRSCSTAIGLSLAAIGCGDEFNLGEIVQDVEPISSDDGSTPPVASTELDGTVLFASADDVDVVIADVPVDLNLGHFPPVAVGDVDGDGFGDWIHQATLYYGSARPSDGTLIPGDRLEIAEANNSQCGEIFLFERAGDVNGDGYADLFYNVYGCIIWYGVPDEPPLSGPPAYLLLGGPERRTGTVELSTAAIPFGDRDPLFESFSEQIAANPMDAYADHGNSLRSLGDLDGDGLSDFSVSTRIEFHAPGYTFDEELGEYVGTTEEITREGVSYVYYGSSSLDAGIQPAARLDAPVTWQELGDVDGDGARDTLLTSPERHYVWRGRHVRLSGELTLADGATPIESGRPFYDPQDALVRAIGDLDGDGFDDFTLTNLVRGVTYLERPVSLFYGRRDLLSEPRSLADRAAVFDVYETGDLTALGDWNNDGHNDLLLDRMIYAEGTSTSIGVPPAARESVLLQGSSERFAGTYTLPIEREGLETPEDPTTASTRYAPTPAGDLDGDGFDDLFFWALYEDSPAAFDLAIKYGRPAASDTVIR